MVGRGFNVGVFRAEVNKRGILRQNKFLVEFTLPPGINGTLNGEIHRDTVRTLEYWCEDVALPGHRLRTVDAQRYGYGAIEQRPVNYSSAQLFCTFREDADAHVQKLFHRWMNVIFNIDMREGPNGDTGEVSTAGGLFGGGGVQTYQPYEVSYRDEYLTEITVYIYDLTGRVARQIKFREAFPIQVGQVHLAWDNNNSYFKLPVSFAFTDFYEQIGG